MLRYRRQAGDTIIEVMLAFTVFALLAVGTITIMNQGVASAQEALETTLVRQQIDGQAETLRFLHQAYLIDPTGGPTTSAGKFNKILQDKAVEQNATSFGDKKCLTDIPTENNPFIVNPRSGVTVSLPVLKPMNDPNAPAYAQIQYSGTIAFPYGMWVEAVKGGESGQPEFIDFHIRACWYSMTNDAPRTLGTIVRLYVPAL